MQIATLEKPWVEKEAREIIVPVFLPFAGCRGRCIFCAQEAQTGAGRAFYPGGIQARLKECEAELLRRKEREQPLPELAFYGGTFTALAPEAWTFCLDFARNAIENRLIKSFRCSTRPDRTEPEKLKALRMAGCSMVELGAQTFNAKTLAKSARGYSREECMAGCRRALDTGLGLCVHLMPGLPGMEKEDFFRDVEEALAIGATAFRLSPCLVLEGTPLARLWHSGKYSPWDMDTTLDALASAWLAIREAGATVIRVGLAPQKELLAAILAGPAHECLGSRVAGRALLLACSKMKAWLKGRLDAVPRGYELYIPAQCKGYLWGWKSELAARWQALGFTSGNIHFHPRPLLEMRANFSSPGNDF